jgi:hypothetical protein
MFRRPYLCLAFAVRLESGVEEFDHLFGRRAEVRPYGGRKRLVAALLPEACQRAQGDGDAIVVLELQRNLQILEQVLLCLRPLPLLLRHPPQLMVGAGLAVAVVELDLEGQRLLVVLLRLRPLPLLLRDIA